MKIFGLHKIVFTKLDSKTIDKTIYFIIMNNAFNTSLNIDLWYDIKGSLYNWETWGNNWSIAKKDLNFLEDKVSL